MKKLIAENTFKSKLSYLPKIQKYIESIAKEHTNNSQIIESINFAVAEAASNSIKHGNKLDSSKEVLVKIFIDKNKLIISFLDSGSGFNPKTLPDPTKPENILSDNGRGIFIIKNVANSLQFKFSKNGTETILTFLLK